MSMRPQNIPEIPEETCEVAQAAFPKGNAYMAMRDAFGGIYQDEQFKDLFSHEGQPAESPWRLAMITLMQFAENLTDRQAADAVRARIDWKYALSLPLRHPGFHYSVLSEFRTRLVASGAEQRLFDLMLNHCREQGWIKERGRQRTDSTPIFGAIRLLNRLELVGETLYATLNTLAQVAPAWVKAHIPSSWAERYYHSVSDFRLPKEANARKLWAEAVGSDGYYLLDSIYEAVAPGWLKEIPQVQILRKVWLQNYIRDDDHVEWRKDGQTAPSAEMVASPYETEARYSSKRGKTWIGYKVHITETCDEAYPHLVTHVDTTVATEQDNEALARIHNQLSQAQLLPSEHLMDAAYVSSELIYASLQDYGVELVCPSRPDTSWQAKAKQGFSITDFTIDWEAKEVTCPQGKKSIHWLPEIGPRGKPTIQVQFTKATCANCTVRSLCTRSKLEGRGLTLHPSKEEHLLLQATRERQETADFKERYKTRAGIEGTISQAAYTLDMRRTRYRGTAKTGLQHACTAAAINLSRALAWLQEKALATTRKSPFVTLVA